MTPPIGEHLPNQTEAPEPALRTRANTWLALKTFAALLLASVIAVGAPMITATPEDPDDAELRRQLEDVVNFTKGKSDICPVHKAKMTAKDVPIQFGLLDGEIQRFKAARFPFADEFIPGGCVVDNDPRHPKSGKVFVCRECVAAWNRFIEEAQKRGKEKPSK